ncbi:hypothetical protein F4810DRAFT_696803 [Camillea tinctor]|nr:hypothetical protein F4810DRAFT_696803 [Camillea tinctor]
MHFFNIIKVTTGVMVIGGVDAGIVMPQARSEAGIEPRFDLDWRGIFKCGTCIAVAQGMVKGLNREDHNALVEEAENLGVGYVAKQLCERADVFEKIHIHIPGAPFCKKDDDVSKDGSTVNNESTSNEVSAADKEHDGMITKALELVGTKVVSSIVSRLVERAVVKVRGDHGS